MPLRSLNSLALAGAVFCLHGCQSEGSGAHKGQPVPPTAKPAVAPDEVVKFDAAGALRFLDAWVGAQNAGEFARYAALYADDFSGTKNVQGNLSHYDRAQWLADRKPMFDRAATVSVARVEVFDHAGKMELTFEQRWTTSTFADVGNKRLVLTKAAESYRITREEMLSSQLDDKRSKGPCARAFEALAASAKDARYFAALGTDTGDMVEVSSYEDAHAKSADGFAWEVWATATDGDWRAANAGRTSSCGAWSQFTHSCFRPGGSLAEVTDRFCSYYHPDGLVCDNVTLAYSPDGELITRAHEAYLMGTGKPPPDQRYRRDPPTIVLHTRKLPFKL